MPNITPVHLIVILVVAVLVLGPGKLPEVGAALGKSIREFRKAATDIQEGIGSGVAQSGQAQAVAAAPGPVQASAAPASVAQGPVAPATAPAPSDQPIQPAPELK